MLNLQSILVSGCAGDIGLSIGRILKSEGATSLVGCDIMSDHVGQCVFDICEIIPRADDCDYFSALKSIFIKHNVTLFIPSSEAELSAILTSGFISSSECLFGVPVLMASKEAVRIGLDKFETVRFLSEQGIEAPWCRLAKDGPLDLPSIYKPRSGQGSKGLEIVGERSRAELLSLGVDAVWQELLLPNDEEYTCGMFKSRSGLSRSLIFRRVLAGGLTTKGAVVQSQKIQTYLDEIVDTLDFTGAINIQLRLTKEGPRVFEINPRFSSTVMFRHKLGFKDLIWAIQDRFGEPISDYLAPADGTKFYRGYSEYIV